MSLLPIAPAVLPLFPHGGTDAPGFLAHGLHRVARSPAAPAGVMP